MRRFFSFVREIIRKSVIAFFVTLSVSSALFLPLFFLLVGTVALSSDVFFDSLTTVYAYGKVTSSHKILAVPIRGIIFGDAESDSDPFLFSLLSDTYGYDIKRILRKAAEDSSIKAILLEINSPGGTIYGSQAIADGIRDYQSQTNKPVYAHVSGFAASGAYWAAVGADKIIADAGSIIGSIGVINGQFFVYNNPYALDNGILGGGVTTKDGVQFYSITSGKGKDLGNPFRSPTAEELQILQRGADANYALFVQRVSERRGIPVDTIRNDIGAYVYDNDTAIQKKLLDMTGSREFAYAELAKVAEISDNYQVVRVKDRRSRFDMLLNAFFSRHLSSAREDFARRLKAEFCTPYRPLVYYGDVSLVCGK